MNTACCKVLWTMGLMGVSAAALADAPKSAPPQEPVGFIAGGVIGGFAAGPVGAVIGAGLGTWLGNRVHRAGEAAKAEAQVAVLESEKVRAAGQCRRPLKAPRAISRKPIARLTARLDELSHRVEAAQTADREAARDDAATVLDGLQGDVLFRTGSADVTPEMAHEIQSLAEAVAKSSALKVRLDGYADPRGTVETNLELSQHEPTRCATCFSLPASTRRRSKSTRTARAAAWRRTVTATHSSVACDSRSRPQAAPRSPKWVPRRRPPDRLRKRSRRVQIADPWGGSVRVCRAALVSARATRLR